MHNKLEQIIEGYWKDILKLREEIHQNPELAYEEFQTSETIKGALEKYKIPYKGNICKTGIVALIEGGSKGKTVAIRCDMDALPMEEKTGVSFASKNKGVMHACGHDAHMAMVLGASYVLNHLKHELRGSIKFIFQPAEEHGIVGGAKFMIEEGVLENPKVDGIFGIHVWPEIGENKFGVTEGEMMASCDVWRLKLKGKGGHISAPHKAKNPIFVAAQLINGIAGMRTQNIDPFENVIIDIGSMHAGTVAGNIIPDEVTFAGNVRVYNNILRKRIKDDFTNLLEGLSKSFGISYDLDYNFGYAPIVNNPKATEFFKKSSAKIIGEDNILSPDPVMGSEDFGEYMQVVPGAFGWLGVKQESSIDLHNPRFIVDEETIKKGILIYCQTVMDFLNENPV